MMAYTGCFLICVYFAVQLFDAILALRFIDLADYNILSVFPLKDILGILLSGVVTGYFWMAKSKKYVFLLDEVIEELKTVVWPTKEETKITTISVFVFTFIMLGVFFVLDLFWSTLANLIY